MIVYFLELGPIKIPSFGLLIALSVLGAVSLFKKLSLDILSPQDSERLAFYTIFVGILGAKLWFEVFYSDTPFQNFFSNGYQISGFVFYGGFLAGLAFLTFWCWARKISLVSLLNRASIPLLFGYGFGRLACQVSGDGDYGIETDSFLGMPYPTGVVPTLSPVFPTPIFESFVCLTVSLALAKRWPALKEKFRAGSWTLIALGLERFLVEFVRRNPKIGFGFSEAQIISLLILLTGLFLTLKEKS